jgi:hypothetical protein
MLLGRGTIGFASADAAGLDFFEMEADGAYAMQEGDTEDLAEHLAVFQAKRSVAEAAERYFGRRGRISPLGGKRDEIVNYTADRASFTVLQKNWVTDGISRTYRVRLKVNVQPADFIEAEIESLRLEKAEAEESLRNEMEPAIAPDSLPGRDIAKAYRHIRKGELRLAIIYLDRLQTKYPNWPDVYEVKALAYHLYNQPEKMSHALRKACELGSAGSCAQLQMHAPGAGHE